MRLVQVFKPWTVVVGLSCHEEGQEEEGFGLIIEKLLICHLSV